MNQLRGLRCCRFLLWCWFAMAFAIPVVAQAQIKPWPDRPIKVVVPAPPGSAPDVQCANDYRRNRRPLRSFVS
jgi:hypothetical protein